MKTYKTIITIYVITLCVFGFPLVNISLQKNVDKPSYAISTSPLLTSWSQNSKKLLVADKNDLIEVWNFSQAGKSAREISLKSGISGVSSIAFNDDGTSAIIGYQDGTLLIWDTATNKIRFQFQAHKGWVSNVIWSPDETKIASSSVDGMKVWEANSGANISEINQMISSLIWASDSSQLIGRVAGDSGDTVIWAIEDGHEITHIDARDKIAISPNGMFLFASYSGIWDLSTVQLVSPECEDCYGTSSAITWDHNSRSIAVGSGASMCFEGSLYCVKEFDISVWDTVKNPSVIKLSGHTDDIIALAWNMDNTTLFSVSLDDTLRTWDVITHDLLSTINLGDINRYSQVNFSPDGNILAVIKDDVVDIWFL
jgi:WD40 repeat protein